MPDGDGVALRVGTSDIVTSASLVELVALNDWAELLLDGVADSSRPKTEGEGLGARVGLGLRTEASVSVPFDGDLSCRLRFERSDECGDDGGI